MQTKAQNDNEIIIMGNINEIVKYFVKDNIIVWCDPNVESRENSSYQDKLKTICNIKTETDWEKASSFLQGAQGFCQVIASGTNGENLVKQISNMQNVSSIYVFCLKLDYHKGWAKSYPKIVCVENSFDNLFNKIQQSMLTWQRQSSSLRIDFPAFAPIFDDAEKSENSYLHLLLKGLVNFKNRDQAKKDFLTLAKSIYQDKKYIEDFHNNYNDYDMKKILNWYTKECFLYKLTNNCLRLATSDAVQYCRLILRDLEVAIKEMYQKQSKNYNGLLYRGAYISSQEWKKLEENIGKDIEMYGFLSTTKSKNVALAFGQSDIAKKAFITMIVPSCPEKGEQGFAEVKEFSDFKSEEEVLFNVRSRFTVLEASTDEIEGVKCRHLVLLYGAQSMRRYLRQSPPNIEIQANLKQAKCNKCKSQIKLSNQSLVFINLSNLSQYTCHNCLTQYQNNNRLPLLCISSHTKNLSNTPDSFNAKIQGIVMQYPDNVKIPFYGHRCTGCNSKLSYCYQCLSCENLKKMYCGPCLHQKSTCIKEGHCIVLTNQAFSFWGEKMQDKEFAHIQYQENTGNKNSLFQQAQTFYNTHDYKKAIEYYTKYLEKNTDDKDPSRGDAYDKLGLAYNRLSEHSKALECHLKAFEICKSIFGEVHGSVSSACSNIGISYSRLGDHQKSLEFHCRALEIALKVYGDYSTTTGASYHNIGLQYQHLGQYQKASMYYLKDLLIIKKLKGDNDPEVASAYSNLGNLSRDYGENDKAIEYLEKALEIRKTIHGDKHPDTATSYNNLGLAYESNGQKEKAFEFLVKTLEIKKQIFGDVHADVATALHNLASIEVGMERHNDALQHNLKGLEIKRKIFGDKHVDIGISYNHLGSTYNSMEENNKALECYFKTLELWEPVYGEKHVNMATLYSNIANSYSALGDNEKAVKLHLQALEIRKQVFGDKHTIVASSYEHLGSAILKLGVLEQALSLFLNALKIKMEIKEDNHFNTATLLNKIADVYDKLGQYEESLECLFGSLEILKSVKGDQSQDVGTTYFSIASINIPLKRYDNSIKFFGKALQIFAKVLGQDHPMTLQAKQTHEMFVKNFGGEDDNCG